MNQNQVSNGQRPASRRDAPLWKHAYEALSRMIQERTIPAGAPIVELQLAEKLGISRTPLRQALQRLEIEGLLRKTVNQSYEVRRVELKEYLQSLKVRELLEAEAAVLSNGRIPAKAINSARCTLRKTRDQQPVDMLQHWQSDEDVHALFIDNCGNEILSGMIRSLRVSTKLFEIERLSERLKPDSQQHERILDALDSEDVEAVRTAVVDHLQALFSFALKTVC